MFCRVQGIISFLFLVLPQEFTTLQSTNPKKARNDFGGLVVSMLASGSNPAEVVGFFRYMKKSSACLLSEGK
jgi:hypothetical protein